MREHGFQSRRGRHRLYSGIPTRSPVSRTVAIQTSFPLCIDELPGWIFGLPRPIQARLLGLEAGRRLRPRQDRPETSNAPPQAEYSSAIGSSLQLRNRPRVETTTRTLGVETTRGVAVAPDVFSFFSPKKEPGAEPQASSVGQASTAETPGRV